MLLGVLGLQNPTERAHGLSFAFFFMHPLKPQMLLYLVMINERRRIIGHPLEPCMPLISCILVKEVSRAYGPIYALVHDPLSWPC